MNPDHYDPPSVVDCVIVIARLLFWPVVGAVALFLGLAVLT